VTEKNEEVSTVAELLVLLENQPQNVEFKQVMQVINENYHYQATAFTNGEAVNEAGTNEGSCKIFAFAHLNKLNQAQTLACFGDFYRTDVLANPDGDDHANIRNFMMTGWPGIKFNAIALQALS